MGTQQEVNSAAPLSPTMIDPDIEGLSEKIAQLTAPPALTSVKPLEDINDDDSYKFARTFGVGNFAMHLPKSSSLESTLTKYVRLLPARFFPFCPPYNDKYLIQFAHAAATVRCEAAGVGYHDEIILAITIGECFSHELPDSKFETLEKSREAIRHDVKTFLTKKANVLDTSVFTNSYIDFCNNKDIAKHFPNAKDLSFSVEESKDKSPKLILLPSVKSDIKCTTFQTAMKYLYYFGRSICSINKIETYVVVHAYCAMAKRGFVTPAFCHKISAVMKEEIGTDAEFNAEAVRIAYSAYMRDYNNSAVHYLDMLLSLIPTCAKKLRAMLEQAQNDNLNIFILIGKAIKAVPDFNWLKLNKVTKGGLKKWAQISNRFHSALVLPIPDSYVLQINHAKHTLVAYVAIKLLIRAMRETRLRPYTKIVGNIIKKKTLDNLISKYCAAKNIETKSNLLVPEWYKTMLSSLDYPIFSY